MCQEFGLTSAPFFKIASNRFGIKFSYIVKPTSLLKNIGPVPKFQASIQNRHGIACIVLWGESTNCVFQSTYADMMRSGSQKHAASLIHFPPNLMGRFQNHQGTGCRNTQCMQCFRDDEFSEHRMKGCITVSTSGKRGGTASFQMHIVTNP